MNNRAMEFLNEAYSLLGYPGNDDQARLLVRLAIGEVEELLNRPTLRNATDHELMRRIEERREERRIEERRGVLVVDAQQMTPARLTARPRAALPGNGRGL